MVMRQIGPGMISQQTVRCSNCNGTGSQIAEKDKCSPCSGERVVKEKKTLEVFITRGMRHGERVTFKSEGDEAPDTVPGDVVVVLQIAEHALFRREGHNLFHKKKITLLEALTGFSFTLQHLDGRVLRVKPEDGTVVKPGTVLCLREEGMPQASNPYQRGHLYVELDVEFPKASDLDDKAIRAFSAVLPRPAKAAGDATPAAADDVHEVTLSSVDMEAERRRHAAMEAEQERESYESDDDDEHQRRGAPGCQQQ